MSTTIQGVDARGYLTAWLDVVTGMTVSDIVAIPDANWNEPFGGCTKPASAGLADTITNLLWTTEAVQGKQSSAYEHMQTLATELSDKNLAIAKFKEASAALSTAIKEASDETLNSTAMAPWQIPTPVFMLAQIAVSHIWYHDGQFNYVHCLLGDGAMHWMGN